jgi:alginate O-acetyltransferase complex protein AlgI
VIFTEARFLWFYLVVFAWYWAMRSDSRRKDMLLVASWIFYGAWDWRFLGLLLLTTLVDYLIGRWIGKLAAGAAAQRKFALVVSLVSNLGLLGFFKYYNFFVDSGAELLAWLGLETSPRTLDVVLPAGISFYTFQSLSYTIDVYRGQLRPARCFRDFALFVAFFPQLVAGPIVRATDFIHQLDGARAWAAVRPRPMLTLFLVGFVKKAIVADNAALAVDQIFGSPETFGPLDKWLGVALYGVQIYCDFSGYSDMAIATAGLLGYQLTKNFDFPFFAFSITDFWRRWHISLATWFRDYLYIPLGGNRRGGARTVFNLACVFFLVGLWHGASWNFIAFGLLSGVFLIVERAAAERGYDPLRPRWWGRPYVAWVIGMSYVLFRSPDLASAWAYIADLHGLGDGRASASMDARWWIVPAVFGVFHWLAWRGVGGRLVRPLPSWSFALGYGALVALLSPLVSADYQAFIYFQF